MLNGEKRRHEKRLARGRKVLIAVGLETSLRIFLVFSFSFLSRKMGHIITKSSAVV